MSTLLLCRSEELEPVELCRVPTVCCTNCLHWGWRENSWSVFCSTRTPVTFVPWASCTSGKLVFLGTGPFSSVLDDVDVILLERTCVLLPPLKTAKVQTILWTLHAKVQKMRLISDTRNRLLTSGSGSSLTWMTKRYVMKTNAPYQYKLQCARFKKLTVVALKVPSCAQIFAFGLSS